MINRIIVSFFFFDLCLAVLISLVWTSTGVEPHQIQLGNEFLSFVRTCSIELENFKIEIPDIPQIPHIDKLQNTGDWWQFVLNFLISVVNEFFNVFNGIINVLNFIVSILNVIIQLLEFIFIVLKNFLIMRDNLVAQTSLVR